MTKYKSKIFREGQHCYHEGAPIDYCPYEDYDGFQWKEGWTAEEREAFLDEKRAREAENERKREEEAWTDIQCSCPWYNFEHRGCSVDNGACDKESCAPYYFKYNVK